MDTSMLRAISIATILCACSDADAHRASDTSWNYWDGSPTVAVEVCNNQDPCVAIW